VEDTRRDLPNGNGGPEKSAHNGADSEEIMDMNEALSNAGMDALHYVGVGPAELELYLEFEGVG
jgi:hypothetical protein